MKSIRYFRWIIAITCCIGIVATTYGQKKSADEHDYVQELYRWIQLAEQSYDASLMDSVAAYADSAVALSQRMNSDLYYLYALERKGSLLLNDDALAFQLLQKAEKLARINGFDTIQANALISIGKIKKDKAQADSALLCFQNALSIFELVNDSAGIASAYSNLALSYKNAGEYDKSLKYQVDSYQLFNKLGKDGHALSSLINLGSLFETLKRYDTALACYNLAYPQCIALNKSKLASICLENQGVIYYHNDQYEASLAKFLEVIDFNEEHNDQAALVSLYSKLSLVYRALGRKDDATQAINKSLQLAETADNYRGQLRAMNNLAIYSKWDENYDQAEKYYLQSLDLAQKGGYIYDVSKVFYNLSILYETTGEPEKSLDYYKQHVHVKDSMLNEKRVKAIVELEARYEKKADEARILQLQNESAQNEIEKKDIRLERNTILGSGTTLLLVLGMGFIMYRSRSKKNKVIADQKIQQLEDEKKLLEAQSLIVGQENERKRIAQELHDGIGVLLSTAKIHFGKVINNTKDEKLLSMVGKADKLLKDASNEVRDISHNIMPGLLSKFGLAEAFGEMFDEVEDSGKLEVEYDVEALEERLPENTEIMLFRVIQELMNNTLKYAEAEKVTFTSSRKKDYLHLHFTDDGDGFDVNAASESKSLGLSGIRSRVELMNGKVQIKSEKGEGTSVLISVPLKL